MSNWSGQPLDINETISWLLQESTLGNSSGLNLKGQPRYRHNHNVSFHRILKRPACVDLFKPCADEMRSCCLCKLTPSPIALPECIWLIILPWFEGSQSRTSKTKPTPSRLQHSKAMTVFCRGSEGWWSGLPIETCLIDRTYTLSA